MAILTTRASKGAPLSFQEVDNNFLELNNDTQTLQLTKYGDANRASEAQARTGTNHTTVMTPLRVSQAIDEQASKLSIGLVLALS